MKNKFIYRCPNCGDKLHYDITNNQLICLSCDSTFSIDSFGSGDLEEEELGFLKAIKNNDEKVDIKTYKCNSCGEEFLDKGIKMKVCPLCGSNDIISKISKEKSIPIVGIVPFAIDKKQAKDNLREYFAYNKYLPNKVKDIVKSLEVRPLYISLYTFDANTKSHYIGDKGDYYYVYETYSDMNGKEHDERVRKINWTHIKGMFNKSFDDVLILTSNGEANEDIESLLNYNLNVMEKYNPEFTVDIDIQKNSLALTDGFINASEKMKEEIKAALIRKIPADEIYFDEINTKYYGVTFKKILVPIYNASYVYKNRRYHCIINGQTGRVGGKWPHSVLKHIIPILSIFVIILIFVLALVFCFFNM